MPTVLRQFGYRFFFYSNEGQEPPHVHIEGHGGEMKVWLQPVKVSEAYNIPLHKQSKVIEVVKKNKRKLLNAWRHFYGRA